MAPKKKAQKIALSDFLQDTSTGSWADEMEALPTAPAPKNDYGVRIDSGDFMSRPDRGARGDYHSEREELPLPTAPPYTAFLGNLSFDTTQPEIEELFSGLTLNSVKIISDNEGKPKGFGYIEFGSLDDLKNGLQRTGASLAGRSIRISVAEPPKSGMGGRGGMGSRDPFQSSAADDASEWRRSGPLPPLAGGREERPRYRDNGFNSPSVPDEERDWGAARGAKFIPSAPSPSFGGERRGPREGGFSSPREPMEETQADKADAWRSSKPIVSGPPPPSSSGYRDAPGGPRREFVPRAEVPVGPADTEQTWTRGAKFTPSAAPSAPSSRRSSASPFPPSTPASDEPDNWRTAPRKASGASYSRPVSQDRSPEPSPQLAPRRPLNLLPRTSSSAESTPTASPQTSKASPFGAAKAADSNAKAKEIEERLEKEREESRIKREATEARIKAAKEKAANVKVPAKKGIADDKDGVAAVTEAMKGVTAADVETAAATLTEE